MSTLTIRVEETPNPNARRFIVNRPIQDETKGRFFKESGSDPLVDALFAIEGVSGVMLLPGSVTVNKDNGRSWEDVAPKALEALEQQLA